MPLFSVIIPTYNSEKFIRDSIESVLKQSLTDFELIIVDDGSKDTTQEILKEYAKKDPRIQVITTPNSGGPATPTNIGITKAKGTYIAFLDHDDSWKEHKLETLLKEYTEDDSVGFILSNVEVHLDQSGSKDPSKAKIRNRKLSHGKLLAGKYFNTFSMISIRQNILNRIGSLDTDLLIFADYDIIARMVSYNIPHVFLAEPLVTYRIHAHNTSSLENSAKRRAEDLERITAKYAKTFRANKSSLSSVHHAIGRLYLHIGDKTLAIKHYKIAVQNNPLNPFTYVRLLFAFLGERPYRLFATFKGKAFRNVS